MSLTYEPLSQETLQDVIVISRDAWPDDFDTQDSPEEAYLASTDHEDHKDFLQRHKIKSLEYFAVKDTDGKVIGITGLYTDEKDLAPGLIWLGWYAVHPQYQGKGYGKEILTWTVNEAKRRGYSLLRLYTSDDTNEATAQILYEKFGFKEIRREKEEGKKYTTLYKELKL
jgi:GNAT superfamily N-acetyltransferase